MRAFRLLCNPARLLLAASVWLAAAPAIAQTSGILAPGNAAVTGFAGAPAPPVLPSGADRADLSFIDLNGPSLRIVDLQNMRTRPIGQMVRAAKPYTATAALIGQVFAVALDNAVPPNVYVAASSAYGLPIVVPDAKSGAPIRARRGAPDAGFMPGLWGGAAPEGGPGSIWKIDGMTGAVSLFANVMLDGVPNPGPALGGLVFDQDSNSLYVADRGTGMIHRLAMTGREIGRYDHGVQGRGAAGLPPVAYDTARRLDITSPAFSTDQPATWSYAVPERRVSGLGIRAGRLYYAVAAGRQIWSVGLGAEGAFADDARLEIEVPPAAGASEISKITFDDQGRMFLADRPDPTGAYDFEALTQEGIGRVLRYAIVASYAGASRVWQPVPDEYAIGFPRDLRNANGGVAIGYDYDRSGAIDRSVCGGFVWSTGEQLRRSDDVELRKWLSGSPQLVDGLQGNYIWLTRPMNVPPRVSYFIDYDDAFRDRDARGHMGDIAIWRVCGPALRGGWMLPGWMLDWDHGGPPQKLPPPPNQSCPADQKHPGLQCCPKGSAPGANGQCKPWCPNGKMDGKSTHLCGLGFDSATYDPNNLGKLRCIGGGMPDAAKGILGCVQSSPVLAAPVCQAGWSKQNVPKLGTLCMPTKQQLQCAPGQQVSPIDNKCHVLCAGTAWPSTQCCAAGAIVGLNGKCCPAGSIPDPKTGACKPTKPPSPPPGPPKQPPTSQPGQPTQPPTSQPGQPTQPPTSQPGLPAQPPSVTILQPDQCDAKLVYTDAAGEKQCCTGGTVGPQGQCCQSGYAAIANGSCCLQSNLTSTNVCCPGGQVAGGAHNAQCVSVLIPSTGPTATPGPGVGGQCCASGYIPLLGGVCCPKNQATASGICCPANTKASGNACITMAVPKQCPSGQGTLLDGSCCPINLISADNKSCKSPPPPPPPPPATCATGTHLDVATGACVTNLPDQNKTCPPPGFVVNGTCCPSRGDYDRGACGGPSPVACRAGTHREGAGCVPNTRACGAGTHRDPRGNCVADTPPPKRPVHAVPKRPAVIFRPKAARPACHDRRCR